MSKFGNNKRPWFKKKNSHINLLVNAASNYCNEPKFDSYGYYGFKLYFPDEDDVENESLLKCVLHFENFIKHNRTSFSLPEIETQMYFTIDYKTITSRDEELCDKWNDLENQIISNTEFCLKCMGLAMHQYIMNEYETKHKESEEGSIQKKSLGIIRARLINYEPIQQIKDIRVNNYGRLISLKGTVIKAANVKIMYQYMAFSCSRCTGIQIVKQPDNIFTIPKKCTTEGCGAKSNFQALFSSPFTRTIDFQQIKIQELLGTDEFENGRVPRTLECELTEDLVNSCVPGDDITITGVIKVRNNTESSYKNNQKSVFLLYLNVISVVNNKNQNESSYVDSERIKFNITDFYAIQKIHAEPYLFRFLVQSFCPSIYGHEIVKAGLVLALFGGRKSKKSRAESHVLMVGDPGMGKSQMLHACANLAPRGVYVCGNTSTGSGLTVTMSRESEGEYALEAGALMLADQGCCCIDEFDKMPTQHACLLEAMEQQSISIAKAGIVCTLPTRATILAAANPAGGHYNKAKTIAENLKISSPMLSRFDLIFILLDQPNEELDLMLSEHVLALHSTKNKSSTSRTTILSSNASNNSLRRRLRLQDGEEMDYLPHSLFRKYIAYAQKYVNPQLSEEAKTVLKEFYFQLRKQFQSGDCTPITTRQLRSLIRLTQISTEEERQKIQTSTVGQFDNTLYEYHRKHRLTASLFGRVINRRPYTPCHNIVKECLKVNRNILTEAMQFGICKENVAIELFKKAMAAKGTILNVDNSGLWVDLQYGFLGASPDGLVREENAIIEVKCLYSACKAEVSSIQEAIALKKAPFLENNNETISLKLTHNYYYQARAKAELREEATKEDAMDIVEIMKETLIDIFTDNIGIMDTTRSQNGTGMSTKNQIIKLLRLMQQKAEKETKSIFSKNEIRNLSEDAGINPTKFYTVLQSLNIQGFILNKGANRYQLVTADL